VISRLEGTDWSKDLLTPGCSNFMHPWSQSPRERNMHLKSRTLCYGYMRPQKLGKGRAQHRFPEPRSPRLARAATDLDTWKSERPSDFDTWRFSAAEGNFVSIPLCGFDCTFQVLRATSSDETAPSITKDSEPTFSFQPVPQTPAPTTPEPPLVAFSVVGATTVSLLEPAQSEPSDIHAQSIDKQGVEETGTAEGGASPEVEKVGYSELGGVGDQIKALKELVELPLRRPEMFRR
jgi:hypothetical protein